MRIDPAGGQEYGGRDRDRTGDLLVANEALSQLSYSPTSSKRILTEAPVLANRRSDAAMQKGAPFSGAPVKKMRKLRRDLRLIQRAAGSLRHDFARVLIQRTRLRDGFHGLDHLRVGLQLHLEPFLHPVR